MNKQEIKAFQMATNVYKSGNAEAAARMVSSMIRSVRTTRSEKAIKQAWAELTA